MPETTTGQARYCTPYRDDSGAINLNQSWIGNASGLRGKLTGYGVTREPLSIEATGRVRGWYGWATRVDVRCREHQYGGPEEVVLTIWTTYRDEEDAREAVENAIHDVSPEAVH